MNTKSTLFSWHNVGQMYAYNFPWIKKQLGIYFLVSLLAMTLYLMSGWQDWLFTIYGLFNTALGFMYVWSPIVFMKGGDSQAVDRMIPASAAEKIIFYVSYLLIGVTAACYAATWLAMSLCPMVNLSNPDLNLALEMGRNMPLPYLIAQSMVSVASMFTCLYFVVGTKANRIKAFLWPVGVMIISSIVQTFYIAVEAFSKGFEAAVNNEPVDVADMTGELTDLILGHSLYSTIMMTVMFIYVIWILMMTYRGLYRHSL
ncbi:MAG: hypothetical protein NC082_04795 [Clostridiales bacterium]|nr:hypothetical protein [Clostridiales bacterium]